MTNEEELVPATGDAPIQKWLIVFAIFMVGFGIFWFIVNFNGSCSMMDPGSWKALQKAANTV